VLQNPEEKEKKRIGEQRKNKNKKRNKLKHIRKIKKEKVM
jgi:hypothetical protein